MVAVPSLSSHLRLVLTPLGGRKSRCSDRAKAKSRELQRSLLPVFSTLAAWVQGLSAVPLAISSIGIGIADEQRDAPSKYDSLGVNKASCFQDAF